ncbi:UNVERIFIED_CONTAM: L-ascorbate peroxidase 3 [Siphonaria sp. JEL0065]|nr:L-ascorbate peroxidase 3 [Siphonaria sp. JEL0065]
MKALSFILFACYVNAHGTGLPVPATVPGLASMFQGHIDVPFGCGVNVDDMPPTAPSQNLAALWLRGAFHDVGKYDPATQVPSQGLLPSYLNQPENNGIGVSIATNFASKFKFNYSSADFIALAGQVTVTHCGGPVFNFSLGRVDAPATTKFTDLPLLPDDILDTYQVIKQKLQRLGFNNQDIVALVMGSHSIGGAHKAISPHATNKKFQPFDTTPGIFDNDVFKEALKGNCVLNVDCNIAKDPELKPIVQLYANDQKAFFTQYAESYVKMTTVGQSGYPNWASFHLNVTVHEYLVEEGGINPVHPSASATVSATTKSAGSLVSLSLVSLIGSFFLLLL